MIHTCTINVDRDDVDTDSMKIDANETKRP